MRYKLRFVSVHKGQGGCVEQDKKKKKRGKKDEAHYYGYLCNFVTSQWYKLDDKDVEDVEENDMLLDVRDKAYMLHYICYESEEYKACLQDDDQSLHHSQEDTYLQTYTSYLGKLNTEFWATLLNDNPKEVIPLGDSDSDSDQPPKLPEKLSTTKEETQKLSETVATTPSQQLPAPSQISTLLGSPSDVLPTAASVSIPTTQQLHEVAELLELKLMLQ